MERIVRFFAQPHRPFFVLGLFDAVVMMGIFAAGWSGYAALPDPIRFHAASMLYGVFTPFFLGFLLTTYPRFSAQPPIVPRRYLRVWILLVGAASGFLFVPLWHAAFVTALGFSAAALVLALRIFAEIYIRTPVRPRHDLYAILLALGTGLAGAIAFLLAEMPFLGSRRELFAVYGAQIGFYGYAVFLAAVVAFRMIPFFAGRGMVSKSPAFRTVVYLVLIAHALMGGEWERWRLLPDFVLAVWFVRELIRIALPVSRDPMIWGLELGIYWLPTAFLLGGVIDLLRLWGGDGWRHLGLHLLALGFLTTTLAAFGTRVAMGHGGRPIRADRIVAAIFVSVQAVVALRTVYSLHPESLWFQAAALGWIALFLLWGLRIGPLLLGGDHQ